VTSPPSLLKLYPARDSNTWFTSTYTQQTPSLPTVIRETNPIITLFALHSATLLERLVARGVIVAVVVVVVVVVAGEL